MKVKKLDHKIVTAIVVATASAVIVVVRVEKARFDSTRIAICHSRPGMSAQLERYINWKNNIWLDCWQ
jgi:hypothetical protein